MSFANVEDIYKETCASLCSTNIKKISVRENFRHELLRAKKAGNYDKIHQIRENISKYCGIKSDSPSLATCTPVISIKKIMTFEEATLEFIKLLSIDVSKGGLNIIIKAWINILKKYNINYDINKSLLIDENKFVALNKVDLKSKSYSNSVPPRF